MSNETDYLISLLMQNKAKKKMLDFVFENNSDADEKKMNAILDEKLRVEKNIENIEKSKNLPPRNGRNKNYKYGKIKR